MCRVMCRVKMRILLVLMLAVTVTVSTPTYIAYHTIRIPVRVSVSDRTTNQSQARCCVNQNARGEFALVSNHSDALVGVRSVVELGGHHRPRGCVSVQRVAVIVPYRGRAHHLATFAVNVHTFLVRQSLAEYRVFVVQQTDRGAFNRAKLFNVGFVEARDRWPELDCVIVHDVELIPLSLSNPYLCATQPRHMTRTVVEWDGSRLDLYENIFGGAVALTTDHMTAINGFSNHFFGWGGEDDEARRRVLRAGLSVARLPHTLTPYLKLAHDQHWHIVANDKRYELLRHSERRSLHDGLNSLNYTVERVQLMPLYTLITVDLLGD